MASLWGHLKRRAGEQLMQERAFVAFKVGLSVSLGTLLSLTPGYAAMWSNPVSLADQVIFTILGGATLTVGGMCTQLFYRLILGALVGSCAFMSIYALGHVPIAQGFVFALVVFALTHARHTYFKADTGLQFATLAAVYAVDYSYRAGNLRWVDWDGLADLMRAWAFGGAISVAVNVLVMPVKASRLARDRTADTLVSTKRIIHWLLPADPNPAEYASSLQTFMSVRQTLSGELDTLHNLHAELAWEVGYTSSDLAQRRELLCAVEAVHACVVSGAKGGEFAHLPEDLEGEMRPLVRRCVRWAERSLERSVEGIRSSRSRTGAKDVERGESEDASFDADYEHVYALVASRVVVALRARDALRSSLSHLESLVSAASARPRRIQPYILETLSSTFTRSPRPTTPLPSTSSPSKPYLPLSLTARLLPHLVSPATRFALKVTLALCALLALLWSPTTRPFFLTYAVRNSTVPLLLALMPTTGLSVLSWTGQLSGAVIGALWAAMSMRIFKDVGPRAYSVPGLFFFEWILCLMVGWRMVHGPDFLAVTAMNACAIFINVQWQLTGTPGQATLPLRLGYMLTTASIAIALAVPFQLLVFPLHARSQLRRGVSRVLRRMAHLATDEVELSGAVLYGDDAVWVSDESRRLKSEVDEVTRDLAGLDGLQGLAAAEWGTKGRLDGPTSIALLDTLHRCVGTMGDHVRLATLGPVDPHIRTLLSADNLLVARRFADACSLTFWSMGASWALHEAPPRALPSVHQAGSDLLRFLRYPDSMDVARLEGEGSDWEDAPGAKRDLGRLWSLTMTLVTQRAAVRDLLIILGQEDHGEQAGTTVKPVARRAYTASSETKDISVVLPVVERDR